MVTPAHPYPSGLDAEQLPSRGAGRVVVLSQTFINSAFIQTHEAI